MKRIIALIFTLACVFGLSGFAVADKIDIGNKQLKELIEQGVPVIDLRRAEEWDKTGVIDGSHLMTFFDKAGRYDAEKWMNTLTSTVNTEEPLILICHSGVRTNIVGKWLSEHVGTVYNVEEGIVSWLKEGNSTVPPG